MRITETVVSRTVRVNLGDYQSIDFFQSCKVEDFADVKEARRRIGNTVEAGLAADIQRHFARRGKKVSLEDVGKRYGLHTGKVK